MIVTRSKSKITQELSRQVPWGRKKQRSQAVQDKYVQRFCNSKVETTVSDIEPRVNRFTSNY
jgi:hypothetical protein